MARVEIRLAGAGGQGLLLAGLILAEAAVLYDGRNACQTQSYGPEARGGASKSEVIIDDEPVDYPKVIAADVLLALRQVLPRSKARRSLDRGFSARAARAHEQGLQAAHQQSCGGKDGTHHHGEHGRPGRVGWSHRRRFGRSPAKGHCGEGTRGNGRDQSGGVDRRAARGREAGLGRPEECRFIHVVESK